MVKTHMNYWLLLEKSDRTRTSQGIDGYRDLTGTTYHYDSFVPNHLKVATGDFAVLRKEDEIIGVCTIGSIDVRVATKIHRRCPKCSSTDIRERSTETIKWRCGRCAEAFAVPTQTEAEVRSFVAQLNDFVQLNVPPSVKAVKMCADQGNGLSSQLSMLRLNPDKVKALLKGTDLPTSSGSLIARTCVQGFGLSQVEGRGVEHRAMQDARGLYVDVSSSWPLDLLATRERAQIIQALQDRLDARQLQPLVPLELRRNIPRILATDGLVTRPISEKHRLAEILADLHGAELLRDKSLREVLLDVASDEKLEELLEAVKITGNRTRRDKISALANRNWHAGKYWARTFVRILGLPPCLAGVPGEGGIGPQEIIEPYVPLKSLHHFQIVLRDQVLELLGDVSVGSRAILTLPTGAGKTRTTVEALVRFLRQQIEPTGLVLWIAQSEELCEQAVASFREVWMEQLIRESQESYLSPPRSLHIHRLWGRFGFPDDGIEPGSVIVAGIQKLSEMPSLDPLLEQIAVLVVDEAHHAIAQSYTAMFRKLDGLSRPILGLTATPFRGNGEESKRLIRRFQSRLLTPPLEKPMEELRRCGILSHIIPEACSTQRHFELTTAELAHVEKMHELSKQTLARIGSDVNRNRKILERLLAIPTGKPVLFFGCNVEHSQLMALLLRSKGRTAASVTAETPDTMRRRWIQEFKDGSLQFLCNVGVLTTGFDAPKIEVIAIARPTASVLLYEQMVGRGMRGPMNGGTEECLLIDFTDNIQNFAEPMSYTRISQMWEKSAQEIQKLARSPDAHPDGSGAAR